MTNSAAEGRPDGLNAGQTSEFDGYAPRVTGGPVFDAVGLIHRVHQGAAPGGVTLVMVHGHLGTEDVTWVFGRAAPPTWRIITPRAPLPDGEGFTWYRLDPETGRPNPASQRAAIAALGRFIEAAVPAYGGSLDNVILLGFSQGAAVSMIYALENPGRVRGVAVLAGFVPGLKDRAVPPLHGLPVLIVHGTHDETIPLKFAERLRDRLLDAGAAVTYDVSETGHKLSAQGMRALRAWLAARDGGK